MKKILMSAFAILIAFTLTGCKVAGDPEIPAGKVLLTEFADMQCPACKATAPLIKKLRERFPDELVVRFVHFPLEQIHANAFRAAEAVECARDGGEEKFWEFVDETYRKQSSLNDETYRETAEKVGLDTEKFNSCLSSGEKTAIIRRDMKEGRSRDVNSTPTLFLNGEKLESRRYEEVVKKIETLLGETPENSPAAEDDAAADAPVSAE